MDQIQNYSQVMQKITSTTRIDPTGIARVAPTCTAQQFRDQLTDAILQHPQKLGFNIFTNAVVNNLGIKAVFCILVKVIEENEDISIYDSGFV